LWFEASLGKKFMRSYLKKPFTTKGAGGVSQSACLEFKPNYLKKKESLGEEIKHIFSLLHLGSFKLRKNRVIPM
jgi:hypothetical protein